MKAESEQIRSSFFLLKAGLPSRATSGYSGWALNDLMEHTGCAARSRGPSTSTFLVALTNPQSGSCCPQETKVAFYKIGRCLLIVKKGETKT